MKSKLAIAAGLTVLSLSLSGCSYFYPHAGETPTPSSSASNSTEPSATPTPTTPTLLKSATVEVLDSSADLDNGIQVIAHVLNVNESDGVCTLTVTSGADKKSVTAKSEPNITDTQCFPLNLSVVGLTPGPATFTVSYKSSKYQGVSIATDIVIP